MGNPTPSLHLHCNDALKPKREGSQTWKLIGPRSGAPSQRFSELSLPNITTPAVAMNPKVWGSANQPRQGFRSVHFSLVTFHFSSF